MSKYDFDFNIDKKNTCSMGFSKSGIIFNKTIVNALGSPKKICIGIDKENKAVAVIADSPNIEGKRFNFLSNDSKRKWVRVQSKRILRAVEEMLGKEFDSKSIWYIAEICENDNVKTFIVDFNKEFNNGKIE